MRRSFKRNIAVLLTAVFIMTMTVPALCAEATGAAGTAPGTAAEGTGTAQTPPYVRSGAGTTPYTTTITNPGNTNPRLGDSAINAAMAGRANAVGTPHSVGGYTKNQLYTFGSSRVLEILTGDYTVFDKTGHKLGTAKEIFNGVWDDLDPAKVIAESKKGGNPASGSAYANPNPGDLRMESVSKAWIKLDIPSNGVYANIENIPGSSGGKLVELKTLSVKKWNYAARYCEIYDKDKKRVTFTRENGQTY